MSQSIPEEADFPSCLDCDMDYLLTPRWHVRQPSGKASRESHRSLCQLDGEPDTAGTVREESGYECLHSSKGLTPLWRLQRNLNINIGTGEENSGSSLNSR